MFGQSHRHQHPRGFTLLELLVVMVIISIVLTVVAVNTTPDPHSQLTDDAQKLTHLIELAQEEAQLIPRSVAWGSDAQGWRLYESTPNGWRLLTYNVFAPDHQCRGMNNVQIAAGAAAVPDAPQRLVSSRKAIDLPWYMALTSQESRVDVVSDGDPRVLMEIQTQ